MTIEMLERIRMLHGDQDIPFERILHAFGVEQILRTLWEVDEEGSFCLRNDRIVTTLFQKSAMDHTMSFYYIGQEPLTAIHLLQFLNNVKDQARMLEIEVELSDIENLPSGAGLFQDTPTSTDALLLSMNITVDGMYIPLVWEITPTKQEVFPKITEISSYFFEEKAISYFRLGAEEVAVSCLLPIFEKMELLNEMHYYLDLYLLLEKEALNGRRVLSLLKRTLQENDVSTEEERLALWISYRNYAYMKKRWKTCLRSLRRKEPAWEDCMDRIITFAEPLWRALEQEELFFGDWMPELLRYLE